MTCYLLASISNKSEEKFKLQVYNNLENLFHRERNMKRSIILLTFLLCYPIVSQGVDSKIAVCTACHGAEGNSANPIWPNLAGQGAEYTFQQLSAFKSKARNNAIMWPIANALSEKDMWEIADYYSKMPVKIQPTAKVNLAGKILYRGGNPEKGVPACMSCHGPNGAGNAPAKYPALRGQHTMYTVSQLTGYKNGIRKHSMMNSISTMLTESEMKDVAEYISSLY